MTKRPYRAVVIAMTIFLVGCGLIGKTVSAGDLPIPVGHLSVPAGRAKPTEIPVLTYHQLDSPGCAPNANVCGKTTDSISSHMLELELAYLKNNGYKSITARQYVRWAEHKHVRLPPKPILITVDDGIENFFRYGTPILKRYKYNAVAFIVTQFADGLPPYPHPRNPKGWYATWNQLRHLDPRVWSFAFHAGAAGHSVIWPRPADRSCTLFYPCQLLGESPAHYEHRIAHEVNTGNSELSRKLPRVNHRMWAVPFNDLGQPVKTYHQQESGETPRQWLPFWAADQFPVIFLSAEIYVDAPSNLRLHEHFRFEVHGWDQEMRFQNELQENIRDGAFNG